MKNKNEIHLNIDTDKSISLPDLCKAVRKGQLIAASIDKKKIVITLMSYLKKVMIISLIQV